MNDDPVTTGVTTKRWRTSLCTSGKIWSFVDGRKSSNLWAKKARLHSTSTGIGRDVPTESQWNADRRSERTDKELHADCMERSTTSDWMNRWLNEEDDLVRMMMKKIHLSGRSERRYGTTKLQIEWREDSFETVRTQEWTVRWEEVLQYITQWLL